MTPELPVLTLIGQPNCGKSTLFNSVAGLKAETSNFPGTTVKHTHSMITVEGRLLNIIDLPGTYSLNPADPAEKVALTHLFREKPDVVINVIDASLLGRSLELTLELLELNEPMIVALNMMDLAEKKGAVIDVAALEQTLGVPVVPLVARRGQGVKALIERVLEVLDAPRAAPAQRYSLDVEAALRDIESLLPQGFPLTANRRVTSIKLIESSGLYSEKALAEADPRLKKKLDRTRLELESRRGKPAYEIIAAERHHLSLKIFEECCRLRTGSRQSLSSKADAILMHPFYGYLIFLAILIGFFFVIFKVGNPLENLLLSPLQNLRQAMAARLGAGGIVFHLADGLLQGIGGGLAVVLPYFVPLLFLMAFLEDVGYLARAGFLMDTFMHRIGLHGKSVSPFILGFGCNVPAIVATRILESRRDRVVTALLIPFIPCSARTTIILALVAFYLGPWWALGFYGFNILLIAVLGRVISLFMTGPSPGLILEIPSLKMPSLKSLFQKTYFQLSSFLKFAWPLLILGSLALSLLQFFGADAVINAALSPLVVHGLGLPRELGVTLVFGFLRKELSLLMMLQALGVGYRDLLTVIGREQLVVFTVFISLFIPCLSTFGILWKELGRRVALLSAALSVGVAVVLSLLVRAIL
ncbi:MAG: ferrous iron transport protein B [Candidatus Aminicenantes bacterium]|nr:ferrous iron transport protein B [Candidatus Aminicenantes bacterium]